MTKGTGVAKRRGRGRKRIALFGGSFNPPGLHHRRLARFLADHFDEVIVVPCGLRPDKPATGNVPPLHRAVMADLTFRGLPGVRVDLFDIDRPSFTPIWQLEERFGGDDEAWHVVGTDIVAGGGTGRSEIQRSWQKGRDVWRGLRFAVVDRPGFPAGRKDMPPRHRHFSLDFPGTSREIRSRIFHHREVKGLLAPAVAAHVERYGLYQGRPALHRTVLSTGNLRLKTVVDQRNPGAVKIAAAMKAKESRRPDLIVVVGGDGTMLRAIRRHWRKRVPFYGINAGHLGFLLNESRPWRHRELVVEQLPLLQVEAERSDGRTHSAFAFNDAWVERATGQTAWLRVLVDGRERLDRLVADGALVSTAAGSTSYARAMGAAPLPLNTQAMLFVGSNVLKPDFLKPVILPLDADIAVETLDPRRRPLKGYIDGVPQGRIRSLRVRVSRIAAAELAFDPARDFAEKLARIQFPPMKRGNLTRGG